MEITKLTPAVKAYIWGGEKLKNYGKTADGIIAETWELSFHKDGMCLTPNGRSLAEVVTAADLGENVKNFDFFPMLIKFIDAADNLSVQVHPSDAYSLKNEGQLGKTEMWYVVDAEQGAGLYMGFKRDVSQEEFAEAIKNNTVTDLLNFIEVKKGEHYFIKSGTVHAIGKGTTICEIQQNSNVTYRVYDYDRRDAQGNARPLHIEKAKAVSDLSGGMPVSPAIKAGNCSLISACKYFTVHSMRVEDSLAFNVDGGSFAAVSCVEGKGSIGGVAISAGDTLFIPAEYGEVKAEGKFTALISTVRAYSADVKEQGGVFTVTVRDDLGFVLTETSVACGNATDAVNKALSPFGMDCADLKKAL